MKITRKLEFDAGHRIPDHGSKCRNAHGHRYVLEAAVTGAVKPTRGKSDDGMVVDFGVLKQLMNEIICDQWDHSFLVYEHDAYMLGALAVLGDDHRTVKLPFIPTVENLAQYAFDQLFDRLRNDTDMTLVHIRLYETPNCWADVYLPSQPQGD